MSNQPKKFDVAIVGGGIVGLANAWMAARMGRSVVLLERDRTAVGASVRNFGMIWPIGQPKGELFELALRSRSLWLELKLKAGIWVNECGSIHLARHEDEQAILEEFVQGDWQSKEIKILTPVEIAAMSNGANTDGLLCGMWSPFELCVNPPQCIGQITRWIAQQDRVCVQTGVMVSNICDNRLTTSCGQSFQADRIAVCSGSDFETLFPDVYRESGLKKCKLQMMATDAQPDGWTLGPHLAGGLTLRHYRSFDSCPTLPALKQRIADEKPLLDKYGIHVMASQNDAGHVVLGDSHIYDGDITPFDSTEIDELIMDELASLIRLPQFKIARRWHGIYAKHPEKHVLINEPFANCKIINATGGAGMTLSFGLAEQLWENWN
jgi:D-hydroxyproline dehydrogenase subunit beta